jgi:DNA invertase Pin-like site-specific DNA recombinase
MAELLAAIYAWMARAESARRSERVRAGLERRRREGRGSAAAMWPGGKASVTQWVL